jgi:hypothetical protein
MLGWGWRRRRDEGGRLTGWELGWHGRAGGGTEELLQWALGEMIGEGGGLTEMAPTGCRHRDLDGATVRLVASGTFARRLLSVAVRGGSTQDGAGGTRGGAEACGRGERREEGRL